ncbi:DUF4960 domain-containing protein [Rufibacter psychrotolerans]|uniref:DUF4960 domain-containing protein n=1 Tax=Rufibacter psychrotolerans TaxID=2812556 RepID=UPI001967E7C4|nr:DUF4960 domain-containing protein [Rufibacter sp. SYSU D00308]
MVFMISGCEEDSESTLDLDGDVDILSFQVQGAQQVTIDEKKRTIVITYPGGSDISHVVPAISVSEGASISPASGTPLDLRSPQTFTLVNGNLFKKYTVSANVLSVTAFLSHHSSVANIQDDDEKALATWFFDKYDDDLAAFVSFQDIKNGTVDLSKFKTIMWYLDGDAEEKFTMPAISQDPEVLAKLKDWYKEGGNFYMLGYANQYFFDLERMENTYRLAIGNGQGFENGDTWGVNVNVNRNKDNSSHGLFAGINLTAHGDGRKTFPVLGAGWREDHNFVLVEIPAIYGLPNDSESAYTTFTQQNNARWLATWDGIGDYFMAGIVELLPTNEFKGRGIWQGIGGIEWNQNDKGTINPSGTNAHQANVEKLAENAIRYLAAN